MPKWRISIFALVLVAMVVSFAYLRLRSPSAAPAGSVQAQTVIERTAVTDALILEQANPAFYGGVKDGDVVLRYEDRLELYRPSENRLIRSAPLGK